MIAILAILDVLAITWCNLRDWARAGCGDLGWVWGSRLGAGIVNCVFTPQAEPERPENHSRQCPHPELHRTYPRRFRTSVNNPAQINYAPAARPVASSTPRALVVPAFEQAPEAPRLQWISPHTQEWRGRALFHDVRAMHEE
jgi:hypothetical protein